MAKFKLYCLIIILFLGGFYSSQAQDVNNRGKEFWVGYGHHNGMTSNPMTQDMRLYFHTGDKPTTVTVSFTNLLNPSLPRTIWFNRIIPANTAFATDFVPTNYAFYTLECSAITPWPLPPPIPACNGEGPLNRAIQITSDEPIAAYAHIFDDASSGATMLLPVESWGYHYITANSNQIYPSCTGCYSWCYIIANHDDTKVEIIPSQDTRGGHIQTSVVKMLAGQKYYVTLNKGQAYQFMASNNTNPSKNLTGTSIKSVANSVGKCYPVAVFSGSSRTANPQPCGSGGGDNDNQQCFPTQTWGKKYLTMPMSSASLAGPNPSTFNTHSYKVLVKDSTTKLFRNKTLIDRSLLKNGNFYEFPAVNGVGNQPQLFEADKPIMVAQFMTGGPGCLGGGYGDPEMVLLSSIEQGINKIGFIKNSEDNIQYVFLSLIIHKNGLQSLLIDNSTNFTNLGPHPQDPDYLMIVKSWSVNNSPPSASYASSDSPFVATTYGLGSVESYGFNAGTYLRNLLALPTLINVRDTNQVIREKTCTKTPANLFVSFSSYEPKRMTWLLSQVNQYLSYSDSPNVALKDVYCDSAYLRDSLFVRIDTGSDGSIRYVYKLNGSYMFDTSGRIFIPIEVTHELIEKCDSTDKLFLAYDIFPRPKMNFDSVFTGCYKDTVWLNYDSSLADPGVVVDRWEWEVDGIDSLRGKQVKFVFDTAGIKKITLRGVASSGCLGDTTMFIRLYNTPTASISEALNRLHICEGGSVSFTPSFSYDDPNGYRDTSGNPALPSHYYWISSIPDTIKSRQDTAQPYQINTYTSDSFRVRLAVALSNTCVSDTVEYAVKVHSKPIVGFGFPDSCLPASGAATLEDRSTIPDGLQTINSWSWTLTDTSTSPATVIPFNVQNPATFVRAQSYPISLTVTTDKGCTADSTINVKFNLKPVIAYNNFSPICESEINLFNAATATVTNGVAPGVWSYSGPGTSSSGLFDAGVAGDGTWTLRAIYESDAGCKDTAFASITVWPKPSVNFQLYPSEICEGESVNVRNKATLADPVNNTFLNAYTWDMGDGTGSFNRSDKQAFDRVFNGYGTFQVKLVAFSNVGCKDSTERPLVVHAKPNANFIPPAFICMPNGRVVFVDSTVAPDGASMDFKWDFGDGSIAYDRNPVHTYATIPSNTPPSVDVTMIAATVFGCTDTITKSVTAFYEKPTASFTVAPDEICEDNEVVFTGIPPATGGIAEWYWELGDDSTSDLQSFSHIYKDPGNYDIKLIVKNAVGCPSDIIPGNVIVNLQPVVDAGWSYVVPQGTTIRLAPIVNDSSVVTYLWTPQGDIVDPTVLRPVFQARTNNIYTLTVTGPGGCTDSDSLSVKILLPFKIPNAFSPNGDNINDFWEIDKINEYPGVSVQIFNRYGQVVYNSVGYSQPWDGTSKGKPLPVGTYYYVIKPMNGLEPIAGSVTIIR